MTDHTTSVDITSVDSVFDVIVIGAGPVGETTRGPASCPTRAKR